MAKDNQPAEDNRPDDKCYGCPYYDEDYCWYVPCDDLVCNP